MTRFLILLSALFLACDVDSVIASVSPREERSDHAADCARGAARYAAPGVMLAIECSHVDAGRKWR